MPEKQRGRNPGKLPEIYHRPAKYPGEVESEAPYDAAQELIKNEPCDLSVFRLRLGEDLEYHVAVLGDPPKRRIQRRIEDILKNGEQVTLPPEAIDALMARRREQQRHGPYVERHHFPRKRRL